MNDTTKWFAAYGSRKSPAYLPIDQWVLSPTGYYYGLVRVDKPPCRFCSAESARDDFLGYVTYDEIKAVSS